MPTRHVFHYIFVCLPQVIPEESRSSSFPLGEIQRKILPGVKIRSEMR